MFKDRIIDELVVSNWVLTIV